MSQEDKKENQKRHHGGPMAVTEKAKDFKGSINRLIKELGKYRILLLTSILLAVLSSVLTIYAPNRIRDLTDEISGSLFVNKTNIEKISNNIKNNKMMEIEIDGKIITTEDQLNLVSSLTNTGNIELNKMYKVISNLPENVQEVIKPKMNFRNIKNLVLILIIIYVLSAFCSFIQSLLLASVSNRFARRLRNSISLKINRLPLKFFDKHRSGDILSRVTNDVDTISQSMNQSISTLVNGIVLIIGTLIMMLIANVILALTAVLSTIIGFALMVLILSKSQKYFKARQEELGKLNSHIEEAYSGLEVVKLYNAKDDSIKEFNVLNEKVREANYKSQFLSGIIMPLMGFIGNFGYVAVCIVGALLTMKGHITFGVIVAFITYVRMFANPLTQVAQSFSSLQSCAAASERVFEFLDEEEMIDESNKTKYIKSKDVKGNIAFNNIEFTYDGNSEPTIKNFSLNAKKGQKVAIVGPTGAGKTTIVNLLMRFYEINKGSITIDGVDSKDLTRDNIHELFTMVLQDTWLFDGTIKENIIYNRKNVTDEEVIDVCKKIGLDYFIRTLPNGYDSNISDNDTLSIGQKQLLTIARAMIYKTPFLILDEATSNVDTRTEELVQSAMDKLAKNKTSFIIAHRLSTIKNADIILVMKDGSIIEQGNHNELMAKKGFYSELYNSQFEL